MQYTLFNPSWAQRRKLSGLLFVFPTVAYVTVFFMPAVIGLGVSSLLWVWMLDDRIGVFNKILLDLNLVPKAQLFLGRPNTAMNVIILSVVWKTVGFTMTLLLAGLQAIPNELYESAEVDGAGYFRKRICITWPLMRRFIALALILSVIGSALSFDQFYIMTRGGPRNSTISIVFWIFNNSATYFTMGYGAAISIVLLGILVALQAGVIVSIIPSLVIFLALRRYYMDGLTGGAVKN